MITLDVKFTEGEDVVVTRGKFTGKTGRVVGFDEYSEFTMNHNWREHRYIGYHVQIAGEEKPRIYRFGSLRPTEVTSEDIDRAKEGLMETLKELIA